MPRSIAHPVHLQPARVLHQGPFIVNVGKGALRCERLDVEIRDPDVQRDVEFCLQETECLDAVYGSFDDGSFLCRVCAFDVHFDDQVERSVGDLAGRHALSQRPLGVVDRPVDVPIIRGHRVRGVLWVGDVVLWKGRVDQWNGGQLGRGEVVNITQQVHPDVHLREGGLRPAVATTPHHGGEKSPSAGFVREEGLCGPRGVDDALHAVIFLGGRVGGERADERDFHQVGGKGDVKGRAAAPSTATATASTTANTTANTIASTSTSTSTSTITPIHPPSVHPMGSAHRQCERSPQRVDFVQHRRMSPPIVKIRRIPHTDHLIPRRTRKPRPWMGEISHDVVALRAVGVFLGAPAVTVIVVQSEVSTDGGATNDIVVTSQSVVVLHHPTSGAQCDFHQRTFDFTVIRTSLVEGNCGVDIIQSIVQLGFNEPIVSQPGFGQWSGKIDIVPVV